MDGLVDVWMAGCLNRFIVRGLNEWWEGVVS